ncbi:MAG: MoxR family ATPase [Anaerolineales bacterium]
MTREPNRAIAVESIDQLQEALRDQLYVADRGLATSIYLALKLGKPLFLEGEAGVGKTEVAKAVASVLNSELIRLQCYEGLDIYRAAYDWNYTRQMLHIRLVEARGEKPQELELFGPDFLLERPLLAALRARGEEPPLLLIDEIDRSDAEFEAYLLEVLSDFQLSIPEIGTIRADRPPYVIITSNRTREVHDALKRRCLYHWIEYPSFEKELEIVKARVPAAADGLARQVTQFVQALRGEDLYKTPGVAETLDWLQALVLLDRDHLEVSLVNDTLGALLKTEEDVAAYRGAGAADLVERVTAGA